MLAQDAIGNVCALTWFGKAAYSAKKLVPVGEKRWVAGRLDRYGDMLQIVHPDHVAEPDSAEAIATSEAVYPLSEGLTNARLNQLVAIALERFGLEAGARDGDPAEALTALETIENAGAALARGERITELTVDEKLSAERAKRAGFVGLSFNTIAGFNANGAMPHYRATAAHHAAIEGDGLLLIDSGGQYLGGTTDITRVWAIGTPTAAQQRDFTLVLKGTMALSRTRFPRGTLSPMLDAIARAPLWAEGLDFGHGTGHGVGYFLNVHEGPQSISKAVPVPDMAMQPGMITSIEPGLYRPGQWGIRIENLVLNVAVAPAVPDAAPGTPEHGEYLAFETLSLCPIDTRCIDRSLLRDDEVAWLNAYHAEVRRRLSPRVSGDALHWLEARTQPL